MPALRPRFGNYRVYLGVNDQGRLMCGHTTYDPQDGTVQESLSDITDTVNTIQTVATAAATAVGTSLAVGALTAAGAPVAVAAACAASANALVSVNGYYRDDGTYVRGHNRTHPDCIEANNFSA